MTTQPSSLLRRVLLAAAATVLLHGTAQAQSPASAPRVKLATSAGDIVLELYPDKAPKTVANFLAYVGKGQFDGTIFHRVIPGFMIQGGGFDAAMNQKATGSQIENEAANGLKNDKYTIAMARTGEPHSATAQFFINVADNGFLNHTAPTPRGWGYAVFGKVTAGTDVVDKIATVKTGQRGFHGDVPLTPVFINSATLLK
jgi:cyclophilin family peptidyl-prolyl cis-trans isomerase